jgi:hypothetical protein
MDLAREKRIAEKYIMVLLRECAMLFCSSDQLFHIFVNAINRLF